MFKLTISTENAAFDDDAGSEVARILRAVADKVEAGDIDEGFDGACYDANGNNVGSYSMTAEA